MPVCLLPRLQVPHLWPVTLRCHLRRLLQGELDGFFSGYSSTCWLQAAAALSQSPARRSLAAAVMLLSSRFAHPPSHSLQGCDHEGHDYTMYSSDGFRVFRVYLGF